MKRRKPEQTAHVSARVVISATPLNEQGLYHCAITHSNVRLNVYDQCVT